MARSVPYHFYIWTGQRYYCSLLKPQQEVNAMLVQLAMKLALLAMIAGTLTYVYLSYMAPYM